MFILQTVYSILQTQYTVNNILKKSADLQLAKIILWPSTARFPEEKRSLVVFMDTISKNLHFKIYFKKKNNPAKEYTHKSLMFLHRY